MKCSFKLQCIGISECDLSVQSVNNRDRGGDPVPCFSDIDVTAPISVLIFVFDFHFDILTDTSAIPSLNVTRFKVYFRPTISSDCDCFFYLNMNGFTTIVFGLNVSVRMV